MTEKEFIKGINDSIIEFYKNYLTTAFELGYKTAKSEIIHCKDCGFRDSELACTQFDAYTSAAGDLFMPPDWFYCGYGKRKEE